LKQKQHCKDCDGVSICVHKRDRSRCKDCGGGSICMHGRVRSVCKECDGGSICMHRRVRTNCKECGGGAICHHNKQRGECLVCSGCPHGKYKRRCVKCRGNGICSKCRESIAVKDNFCKSCHPDYITPVPFTSRIACEFFDLLEEEVGPIQHHHFNEVSQSWEGKEFRIPGFRRKAVDGKIPETNVVFEFFGDIWHGHPRLWDNKNCASFEGKCYRDLFDKTNDIMTKVDGLGYEIWYIWESQFKKRDRNKTLLSQCTKFEKTLC